MDDRNNFRILRIGDVVRMVGVSKSQIYRLESDPNSKFPKRIVLGANSTGWRSDEIAEYLANLPRAADAA